jgi:MacB-like periplasmic core domain
VLLVIQVAISLVLLMGAALFLRTLGNLRSVDVGFDTQNLLLFRVNPQLNRYNEQRSVAVYADMIDRLATVPGVRAVALSNPALLSGSVNDTSVFVQGRPYESGVQAPSINRLVISPNFFDVMGIPLMLGRGFTESENNAKSPKVAVINESAAREFFPSSNAIGQRFGSSVETSGQLEVVGIVRNEVPPTMYVPYRQVISGTPTFAVRTAGDPIASVGAIREGHSADRFESADGRRLHANGAGGEAFCSGEGVRAGVYAVWGAGAGSRGGRSFRCDVVQRRAADE